MMIAGLVVAAIRVGRGNVAVLYGVVAGLLYGAAALGTKGASTLVARYGVLRSVPHITLSLYPYIFLGFAGLGMLFYQMGIQRFRITVVGSMSDVMSSCYLVVVGSLVFHEHLPKDPVVLALRFGGFLGVLLGSIVLATGSHEAAPAVAPHSESDLGLGPVIIAEVDALGSRGQDHRRHDTGMHRRAH